MRASQPGRPPCSGEARLEDKRLIHLRSCKYSIRISEGLNRFRPIPLHLALKFAASRLFSETYAAIERIIPPSIVEAKDVALVSCYACIESASEKIGRYSDTSTKPTKTPITIIISGSIRLKLAVTRVATSSS